MVLLLFVTVVLVTGGGDAGKGKNELTRTQRTLLLQVKDGAGAAMVSALLAHDSASGTGAVVLVPPQVLANVPGIGDLLFGRALQTGSVEGSRNALSDLMGVTIDGSWVLDGPTFERLVDREGGVTVDVDVTVVSGRTVVLEPGSQKLAGKLALQFATYLAAGEQEQTRLARVQSVLDGVLNALPGNLTALLGGLGGGSQTTMKTADVAAVLSGLAKDDRANNLQYRSLPVIKIDAGTDEIRFRIDAVATTALVDELLAGSIPAGSRAEGNRVLVLNGVGTPGLGQQVRAKLVPAGFVFVGSRNADRFGFAESQVLVKDATTAGAELGARVAKALGLPASSVKSSRSIGTIADVVVLVGADFKAN